MKFFRVLLIALAAIGLANLSGRPAVAVTTLDSLNGGNKASDYQPPTDNPQGNVSTGLQNTDSSLQPAPGQASVSQQSLNANDLQVLGSTGKPNPNTTSTAPSKDTKNSRSIWPLLLVGGVAVVAGIFFGTRRKAVSGSAVISEIVPKKEIISKPEPLPVQKKPKTSTKKKSSKKRKTRKK